MLTVFRDVLQQAELEPHINIESFGPLLPEQQLTSLREQYLSYKEVKKSNVKQITVLCPTVMPPMNGSQDYYRTTHIFVHLFCV